MSELILDVKNVSLEYKTRSGFFEYFSHRAIDNLSFKVNKGEVIGIVGRNGAGKSTLLKIIAGVIHPNSGEVSMPSGTTVSLLSLGVGFNPDLSGRDNAIISCMLNGFTRIEALSTLDEIKKFSELGNFFEQPVKTYSSGMKSRLGFSTALVAKVDILLIDEVLSVGDVSFRKKAEQAMLDRIKGEQTVLFVSHDAKQIERICNRTIDLSNG